MEIGYYSIDNTETNCQIPEKDYSTTYNVIERFQSVLTKPKINGQEEKSGQWETISNVVVDSNGNTYNLLKYDTDNATYAKIVIIGTDGKLLLQQDIDDTFQNIDTTQKNLVYLMGSNREVITVIINDKDKLYRYYYKVKSSETAPSGLEITKVKDDDIIRDSKNNYYNIDTDSVPLDSRLSVHGSDLYTLIQPIKDESLSSDYPCLMNIKVNSQNITEQCISIKNKEVFQYLPSLKARNESIDEDGRFDFGTDFDVFSSTTTKKVYDPTVKAYLGSGVKMQRFDWSSPNFYYATDDGIGLYVRHKNPMNSTIAWQISSKDLPKDYSSATTDFLAYSSKEKHLFTCLEENERGEDGYLAIVDTDTKNIYKNKKVPCSKDSLVLLNDRNFVSSTKDGVQYYYYSKDFNVTKVRSVAPAAASASSFITAPVVYKDRLYANGNVYCSDTLSKELVYPEKLYYQENGKINEDNQINHQSNTIEEKKDKDGFNYKPLLIILGIIALLAVLGSLLLIGGKRKKRKEDSLSSYRTTPNQSKDELDIEDEDFDMNLNVGVRNSTRYSRVTLDSKYSISSKHTNNSHISQKSLIKKLEHTPADTSAAVVTQRRNDGGRNEEEEEMIEDVYSNERSDRVYERQRLRKESESSYDPIASSLVEETGTLKPKPSTNNHVNLKSKPSNIYYSDTNESSDYRDVINEYSDSNDFHDARDTYVSPRYGDSPYQKNIDISRYGDDSFQKTNYGDKEVNTTVVADTSSHKMSPNYINESTLVESDKLSPSHRKLTESSIDAITPPSVTHATPPDGMDVLYKNSKAPLFPNKNQNKISDAKVGLVKTKTIPTPNAQHVVIVNQMLTDTNPFEEAIIENGSEVSTETDQEIDTKSEKSRKSLSYLTSMANPFISKLKGNHSKNNSSSENTSDKKHRYKDSSSTIFSTNTVKATTPTTSTSNLPITDLLSSTAVPVVSEEEKAARVSEERVLDPSSSHINKDRSSLHSNSSTGTVKDHDHYGEDDLPPKVDPIPIPSTSQQNDNKRESITYNIPDFPDGNLKKNVYKKPLLGKQSKASLMSVDPLKIDSDTFKEQPSLDDLLFGEEGIPPPPEFSHKNILTSDNSSDLSFRTTKTSNSNYSERLNDIKQQYRQFQNNIQNKYSNESSDQTSFFSASAASSNFSNHLEEMKPEEIHLEEDPFDIPPPPSSATAMSKKNTVHQIFSHPSRNGSKTSVKTSNTSYYSANSDFLEDKEPPSRRLNNLHSDLNFTASGSEDLSESAQSAVSYGGPENNDNVSVYSFHSCINSAFPSSSAHAPLRSPSARRNVFGKRESDQFSSAGGSTKTFYSIKSAQWTSQSLPSNANSVGSPSPSMTSPSLGSPSQPQSPRVNSPFNPNSPLMHRESVRSTTSFQSAMDDSFMSNAASVSSQITNPFLRDSIASTATNNSSSYSPVLRGLRNDEVVNVEDVHPSPLSHPPFTDNTDTTSFVSATETFHTVKDQSIPPPPSSSLSQPFRNERKYSSPLVTPLYTTDTSSFVSATESFHTVKTNGDMHNREGEIEEEIISTTKIPSAFIQSHTRDDSSFVSTAESFHTVRTTNTQATEATTSTFKTAKPGYNPFK